MAEVMMVEAVNMALARAMSEDESVIVLGEDVGVDGGVFRATDKLLSKFGPTRVLDTPLSEAVIGGICVGMAAQNLRPVAEIQFMGFIYPVIDQLVNHAGRLRNRTRGRLSCPMVLRAPFGGGIHAPEHHSESTEAMFAHIPGIKVVVPSTPAQAYGLLLAAIRDPDPVVFLEPKRRYHAPRELVHDNGASRTIGKCNTVRHGSDVTLVSWGAMLGECAQAADTAATEGCEVEIIDVASLTPLDEETILTSTMKTGRCVIVHEAAYTSGFGAEITARIAERGLLNLVAPIKRVTGFDTIMPLSRNEHHYIPSTERIAQALRDVMDYQ